MTQSDIHLYTAATMNGYKPVIFLEAMEVLSDQRYADDVRKARNHWIVRGVGGVPAMIFNEQHLVTGAQGIENYTHILRHLKANQAA